MRGWRFFILAAGASVALQSQSHGAVTFVFNYQDPSGQGFALDAPNGPAMRAALEDVANNVLGVSIAQTATITLAVKPTVNNSSFLAQAGGYFPSNANFGFRLLDTQEAILNGNNFMTGGAMGEVTVSSAYPLYLGSGSVPGGQYDFRSIILHELTHALGFESVISSTGSGAGNGHLYTLYDKFLVNASGIPLIHQTSPYTFNTSGGAQISDLTTGQSFFSGPNTLAMNNGAALELYTPDTWAQGSSISHPNGLGGIMDPSIASGTGKRFYSRAEIGVLQDLGYNIVNQWLGFSSTGLWSDASHWISGVPDGAGAVARFMGGGVGLVNLDSPRTLGSIIYNNPQIYKIIGNATLTLEQAPGAGNASISIVQGLHGIQAPIVLHSNLDLPLGGELDLLTSLDNSAGKTINLQGGTLDFDCTQTHGPTAVLNVGSGVVNMRNDPGAGSAYTLAMNVTPASGANSLVQFTSNGIDAEHLRDLRVNAVGAGGNGLVVISAALTGATPNPQTNFGAVGGSVAVYLGDGAGNAGLASRATVENLWRSIALEGYWGLQNQKVSAITRGVMLDTGVVTDPSKNGLTLVPSVDNAGQPVTYLGEDIIGDTNGDGKVDVNDVGVVLQHLDSTPGSLLGEAGYTLYTPGEGDVNGDLTVDVNDVSTVLSHLDQAYAPVSSVAGIVAVPEPTAVMLLTLGGSALLRRGIRRRGGIPRHFNAQAGGDGEPGRV